VPVVKKSKSMEPVKSPGEAAKIVMDRFLNENADRDIASIHIKDIGATLSLIEVQRGSVNKMYKLGLEYPETNPQYHNLYHNKDELSIAGRCKIDRTKNTLDVQWVVGEF
jgi:hypothetical protein